MIDENFIEFCCLDKLVERRDAIQVTFLFNQYILKVYFWKKNFVIELLSS